jgi:hypothetical protein
MVNLRIVLVLAATLLSGCTFKSDLDAAKKQNEDLQAQVSALQAENSELKAQLAKKPELPVTTSLRKAVLGPGYVAVFTTTVKSPISILVTLKSSALGTTKRFELHLNPATATELGHLEGAVIEDGDTITIENNNYSSTTITVTSQ